MTWENTPGHLSCDDCTDTFKNFNDDPPCDDCSKPKYLFSENELAVKLWQICSYHSRPVAGMGGVMPLMISEVKAVCEVYRANLQDFEKILKIEQAVFPMIQERHKESSKE